MEERLIEAAQQNDLPALLRILQQPGIDVNWRGPPFGDTALHYGVRQGSIEIVGAILRSDGVDVNVRNALGLYPLHYACGTDAIEDHQRALVIIQALLDAGANPNSANFHGRTPLVYAIINTDCPISVTEALLDGGADPETRSTSGLTSLHWCCICTRFDVVQLLIRRSGPELECLTARNNNWETPLDILRHARVSRQAEAVRIRRFILQSYTALLARRDGSLCIHSVLQGTRVQDENLFPLPIGSLDLADLYFLLQCLLEQQPGSVRTLDGNNLLPLQVACQRDFPVGVIDLLVREDPGALLLL